MLIPNTIKEAGGSLNDFIDRVRRAYYKAFNQDMPYEKQGWVADVFDDHVIVSKGDKFYRVDFTLDTDTVTFADPPWPEVALNYTPASATEEAVRESLDLTVQLAEASKTTPGLYPGSVILVEGLSANNNEYTANALESGVTVFEGAYLVRNHETKEAEAARPEGSIDDVIGKITTVRVGESDGQSALLGDVFISASEAAIRTKVQEGILGGLSIKAWGAGSRADDGHFVVESFQKHPYTNVAMVTVPAAGGRLLSESQQPDDDDQTQNDLQTVTEGSPAVEIRQLIEGEDMATLQEVQQERDRLLEENARLFRETRTQTGQRALAEALQGATLPPVAVTRVTEAAGVAIEAFATHGSEQTAEQLTEALKALVEAERAYVAQLVPNGAVSGLTVRNNAPNDAQLEEAFAGLGLTDAEAKIAARGRGR